LCLVHLMGLGKCLRIGFFWACGIGLNVAPEGTSE